MIRTEFFYSQETGIKTKPILRQMGKNNYSCHVVRETGKFLFTYWIVSM